MFGFEFFPTKKNYDWDMLKLTGKITETKVVDEKTGMTTITKKYVSNSGVMTIEETESFYDEDHSIGAYAKLKQDLASALEREDYKEAATIKEAIDKLKESK